MITDATDGLSASIWEYPGPGAGPGTPDIGGTDGTGIPGTTTDGGGGPDGVPVGDPDGINLMVLGALTGRGIPIGDLTVLMVLIVPGTPEVADGYGNAHVPALKVRMQDATASAELLSEARHHTADA